MIDLSFYIISLGCAKNQADSERLNASLQVNGFERAESESEADIILINTCGFINTAKEEAISVILDSVGSKDEGKKVVVLGCLSERYREAISKDIPEIDFVYGLYDDKFAEHLLKRLNIRKKVKSTDSRIPLENFAYEYIKIAEGCSNDCSYCAIPLIRGPHRSFPVDDILNDAKDAAKRGAQELIIVAQDIASYNFKGKDLVALVKKIVKIPGPRWIRLMYLHPDHISDEIIDLIATEDKIVPYVDIPFQHASEKILKSMNRDGSSAKYLALVEKLRARVPGIVIRSTFLLGYPGETDDDFAILSDFIAKARLDRVGAFIYSPEEGTKAYQMKEVPRATRKKRHDALMKMQQKISIQKMRERVGSKVQIIVEEQVDEKTWAGRSIYDAPEVDGFFYLTAENSDIHINGIYEAEVTDSTEYDLIGKI